MAKLPVYDAFVRVREMWRRGRSSSVELAGSPPGELHRIAPTVDALTVDEGSLPGPMACGPGLTCRQSPRWPMYRRVERRAVRMQEMMQSLDVDPTKLARQRGGDAYAEARARCLSCDASETCLRWLNTSTSGRRPEFCPNLALFEACKRAP
jgi:hypothetical protein